MSGYYNESDSYDLDGGQDNSGGGLRKQFEAALEELKALRAEVSGGRREETVTGLLQDKGLDPAVASIIPGDADPKAWLEANGHLFVGAAKVTDPDPEPAAQAAADTDPAVLAEQQAQQQMAEAESAGFTAVVTQADIERVESMSAEDLLAEIKKAQGQTA